MLANPATFLCPTPEPKPSAEPGAAHDGWELPRSPAALRGLDLRLAPPLLFHFLVSEPAAELRWVPKLTISLKK